MWKERYMSEKRTGEESVYHQAEDAALKAAAQFFGEEMLGCLGIKERMKRVAPTENVHLEVRRMYEDFNFEMEDGCWYHFEFESDRLTQEDLRRFWEYEAALSAAYHVTVITYVICSARMKKPIARLRIGISDYCVRIIRLWDWKAERVFEKLQEKPAEKIDKRDLFFVALGPLLGGRMKSVERVVKGLAVLRGSYGNVKAEEQEKLQAILYLLATKYLSKEEMRSVKEEMKMTLLGEMIREDGIQEGIEIGREEGREEGIAVLIADNLEEGIGKERILHKLQTRFGMSEQDAGRYYEKYAL